MTSPTFTNVSIYKAIAEEAFAAVLREEKEKQTFKLDGTGYILRYDPERKSFKNSMIAIVFTGMWLEALTHLLVVERYGYEKYREFDRKVYEDKLKLLGINDESLLNKVASFRAARKELVHEKAHFDDGVVKVAQNEARLANEIMCNLEELLS